MIKYKNRKTAKRVIFLVMFIWTFFNGAYANINAPLIKSIAEVQGFTNEIMVNYIATITNLAMVGANIFLSLIGGKKMNMRIWAVVAGVLTIGGSVGAVLVSGSLSAMIFMRFFVGFGAGVGCLIAGAVLPFYFEGKELATVLGVVTAGSGFWGFIFSNISGIVNASFGWKASYMLYLYAIVPVLLFLIFIPKEKFIEEPEKVIDKAKEAKKEEKKERELNPSVIIYIVLAFLVYLMIQLMWSNISTWIAEPPISASLVQVGLAASIMPLASFIGRALNGPIYNKIGRFSLHLFFGMLLAGLILGVVATTFNLSLVAIFLVGATMGLAHPVVTLLAIKTSPKAQVRAQALILAGENIGNFFSTQWRVYINKLSDGTLRSAFHVNAYFVAAVLVLCFVGTFMMMKMEKKQQLA